MSPLALQFQISTSTVQASTQSQQESKFTELVQDGSFGLEWSGSSVAPGESVDFTFSVDVPHDFDASNFYNSFTIRATPSAKTVPEPAFTNGFIVLIGVLSSSLAFKRKLLPLKASLLKRRR